MVRRSPAWVRVPQLGPGRFLAVDEQRRQDFVSLDRPMTPVPRSHSPGTIRRQNCGIRCLQNSAVSHALPSLQAAVGARRSVADDLDAQRREVGAGVPNVSREHAKPPFRFYRFLTCFGLFLTCLGLFLSNIAHDSRFTFAPLRFSLSPKAYFATVYASANHAP